MTTVQALTFPSSLRRGGCAINKKPRSILSRADAVVISHKQNSFGIGSPPRPLHQRRLRNILLRSRTPLLEEEGKRLILACCLTGLDVAASIQPLTGRDSEAYAPICLGHVWSMTAPQLAITWPSSALQPDQAPGVFQQPEPNTLEAQAVSSPTTETYE
jgi:hypothetical protein